MSRYRVEWREEALEDLAAVYVALRSRSIARAVQRIDEQLSSGPKTGGSYLSEGLYRLVEPPLIVYYSVIDDDNIVEVSNVIRITDMLRPS